MAPEPDIRRAAAAEARTLCATLLAALPDWFGRPEAVASYTREIARHDTLVAIRDGLAEGFVTHRVHFGETAEIWLMAVHPERHRRGTGQALMRAAEQHARAQGARRMVVSTVAAESGDPYYARTRAFYTACGFFPLLPFADDGCPMLWMIKPLEAQP